MDATVLASAAVGAVVFLYVVVGLATLVCGIWAIVDAAGRPSPAFQAANTSKALWITLVAVLSFFCGPVGLVISIIYLVSIRPRVMRAQG